MAYTTTFWKILTSFVGWNETISLPTPPQKNSSPDNSGQELREQDFREQELREQELREQELREQELREDWEWMISTAEEIIERQSAEKKKELETLKRSTSSLKFRSQFVIKLTSIFKELPSDIQTRLSESRLDASKRDRIMKDIVKKFEASWLQMIKTHFSSQSIDSFIEIWPDCPYKKNICGKMASMAFHASNQTMVNGLTPLIGSEIMWSIHLCLTQGLSEVLNKSLEEEDHDFLCSTLIQAGPFLFDLWNATAINVGSISHREGRLPSKWDEEKRRQDEKIARLKKEGVILKFNDGPDDPLRKSNVYQATVSQNDTSQSIIHKQTFSERRNSIATKLCFSPRK